MARRYIRIRAWRPAHPVRDRPKPVVESIHVAVRRIPARPRLAAERADPIRRLASVRHTAADGQRLGSRAAPRSSPTSATPRWRRRVPDSPTRSAATTVGVTRDEAIAHGADLAAATPLPVSADLEHGFATDPGRRRRDRRRRRRVRTRRMLDRGLGPGRARSSTTTSSPASGSPRPPRPPMPDRCASCSRPAPRTTSGTIDDFDDTLAGCRRTPPPVPTSCTPPGSRPPSRSARVVDNVDVPVNVLVFPGVPPIANSPSSASPACRSAVGSPSPPTAPSPRRHGSCWSRAPTGSGKVPARGDEAAARLRLTEPVAESRLGLDRRGDRALPGAGDVRLDTRRRAVGAHGHRARLGDGDARRHRRQPRPAADRRGPRRRVQPAAVDRQRLHAEPRRPDPPRWVARRPARPAAHLRHRRGLVHAWPRCCARSRRPPSC